MTQDQIRLKQGLYFYDTVYKRWVSMDEAPFILMFSLINFQLRIGTAAGNYRG